MKSIRSILSILLAAFLVAACTPQQATILANIPAPSETPLPPTVMLQPTTTPLLTPVVLTAEELMNSPYVLPYSQKTVTLTDGAYTGGSGADYVEVHLADPIALGDLNGDKIDDAAVVLAENTGGSGTFKSLIVILDQNGPIQAGAVQLGDRNQIKTLGIQDQRILLDMVVHAPNDPMCCPTQPVKETYTWVKSGIVMTHLTSQTPDGTAREIHIENPTEGLEVTGSIPLTGTVTIAPFENTLAYKLMDVQGNILDQGPVVVAAADMGGPGTFDALVDLSKVPAGMPFQLAVFDVSMADGSTLAMDAVDLIHK